MLRTSKAIRLGVFGPRTSHSLTTYPGRIVFAIPSDSDDSDCVARSPDEPFYVVWVARKNRSFLAKGRRHQNGGNHIRRSGQA
jgi:hypothetical protein